MAYLKDVVKNTDKVVVVALITGGLSLLGILFTSTFGKIYEYRYNVKKYQYEKKEAALNEFSKKLTLWASNEVIKKWLKFRKETSGIQEKPQNILFIMKNIMFSIRKDLGNKNGWFSKLKKGDLLAFVINDIDSLIKK